MKRLKGLLAMVSILSVLLVSACSRPANTTQSSDAPGQSGGTQSSAPDNGGSGPAAEAPAQAEAPKEKVTVRFSEVIHSIFYTPQYVAQAKDFFGEEGLILDTSTSQGSDKGVAALLAGTADVALVGPEAAIFVFHQETPNKVKVFAQLTARDGTFLVARQKMENFQWSDLNGKTIVGWRNGSMPQLVMNYMLVNNKVQGANYLTNIAAPAMAGAFQGGQGDFIQLFEPTVSMLEQAGAGYQVYSVGEAAGPFPYTVYQATAKFIEEHPEIIEAYTRAIYKGMLWTEQHSAREVAEAIQPYFAETSIELLEAGVQRYKDYDTWNPTPVPARDQFDRLQDVMILGGVLEESQRVKYEDIIIPTFAEKVQQEVK